jgi:hypothetical protein
MLILVFPRGVHPISHRAGASIPSSAPSIWFRFQRNPIWSDWSSLQFSVPIFQTRTYHVSISCFRGRPLKQGVSLRASVAGK